MQPHPSSPAEPSPPAAQAHVHRRTHLQACARTADGTPDVGAPAAATVKESA
ncbi:hypothetical protein AB0L47_26305 [Streptomyces bobili]|uniref:hypothetical protein n=1 Tax=Streptomyces bobili TaxID=67280 RepID=UPI00344A0B58